MGSIRDHLIGPTNSVKMIVARSDCQMYIIENTFLSLSPKKKVVQFCHSTGQKV